MNTNEALTWYVVYTKPRCEKKVAALLSQKNIEHYCPLNLVERQWSDRKKVISEPLFTSYVFIHIPEKMKPAVRETNGIINFVYWLGKPAVVRDEEIELIKRFLGEYKQVAVESFPLQIDDLIEINAGPLMQQRGKIIQVSRNKVKVILYSLGCSLIATVPASDVAHINTHQAIFP